MRTSTTWIAGKSGNPHGRPKAERDIQALARTHGPQAIATLVTCLDDPKHKVAAAVALLDRGFGKPAQTIQATNEGGSPTVLHLIAAQIISEQLQTQLADAPTINGEPEKVAPRSLLDAPKPSE